MNKAYAVLGV